MRAASPTNTAPGSAGQNGAHTPGPWKCDRVEDGFAQIDGKDWWSLASVVVEGDFHHKAAMEEQGRANARLIAAAPEVVEHARSVMALLAEHGPSIVPHLLDSDDNAGQRLRTAIAAATGEEG